LTVFATCYLPYRRHKGLAVTSICDSDVLYDPSIAVSPEKVASHRFHHDYVLLLHLLPGGIIRGRAARVCLSVYLRLRCPVDLLVFAILMISGRGLVRSILFSLAF
jgi:hypothetical protein